MDRGMYKSNNEITFAHYSRNICRQNARCDIGVVTIFLPTKFRKWWTNKSPNFVFVDEVQAIRHAQLTHPDFPADSNLIENGVYGTSKVESAMALP
jgi:hypothetical protein